MGGQEGFQQREVKQVWEKRGVESERVDRCRDAGMERVVDRETDIVTEGQTDKQDRDGSAPPS